MDTNKPMKEEASDLQRIEMNIIKLKGEITILAERTAEITNLIEQVDVINTEQKQNEVESTPSNRLLKIDKDITYMLDMTSLAFNNLKRLKDLIK